MSISQRVVASLCLGLLACESPPEEGAAGDCPAGSGAIFVQDGPNGPGCYCPVGFMPDASNSRCVAGDACAPFGRTEGGACVDIDECAQGDVCGADEVCTNNDQAAPTCTLDCPEGSEGKVGFTGCQDINECERGTAGCSPDATCVNLQKEGAECHCKTGFSGDGTTCEACPVGTMSSADGLTCEDIDRCADPTVRCHGDARCEEIDDTAVCLCNDGFVGDGNVCASCAPWGIEVDGVCDDIDECAAGTAGCDPIAICTNLVNAGANCACPANAIGDGETCEVCPEGTEPRAGFAECQDTNECDGNLAGCSPDAECHNELAGGGATCTCKPGFIGDGVTCTYCEDPMWSNDDHTACVPDLNPCAHGRLCSSLADPDGPYPDMQCAGTIGPEQIWLQTHQKTTFPVDCRCPHGGGPGGLLCAAPTAMELSGLHLGEGPNAADVPSGEIKGCATDFDADVIYFGANWADGGDNRRAFVFAMDPVSGDRTLVSGEYQHPTDGNFEQGAGESFDTILDMALGSDGFLYVFEDSVPGTTEDDVSPLFGRSVYRVNLANGDRELWWNDRDARFAAAHCKGPQGQSGYVIDIYNHQFELDENDDMYFTLRGNGIIRVKHDKSACTWVTSNSAAGPGSGFDMPALDSGWAYKDGVIFGTSFFGGIYKVEVATGKRSRIYGGPTGSGPGPGMWHFMYLPYFDLWVAGGNEAQTASYAALFDPETGDTWSWMYRFPDAETGEGSGGQDLYAGPENTNQLRGPIQGTLYQTLIDRPWCASPLAINRLFVASDRVGITIVEMETGNTMNFSQ